MRIPKKALLLAVQRGVAAEDVFSTTLYTGNGSTQTIANGIDLAGEGGLVWIKRRSSPENHVLMDTLRGAEWEIETNTADQELSRPGSVTSFNSDGFSIGNYAAVNASGFTNASWTFRQAPKFFDMVSYTGDGTSGRQIAHDLGVAPGMVVVKRLDVGSSLWSVWHRSEANKIAFLNDPSGFATSSDYISSPNEATFTIGDPIDINANGGSYIAYVFAHGDGGIIQCGGYTGNGSTTGPIINLSLEPQWILFKRSDVSGDWFIHDNKRDTTNPRTAYLEPNTADIETAGRDIDFTTTGFQLKTADANVNANNGTYIYCAIAAPE